MPIQRRNRSRRRLPRRKGYTKGDMEIVLAKEMGFCFGVRRAVEMMEEATQEQGSMVSLGSVVHNPQVVAQLREKDRSSSPATP